MCEDSDDSFNLSEIEDKGDKDEQDKTYELRHEAHLVFFFAADFHLNS